MDSSNLPKIIPTAQNQILIHPDHAAGNLTVPANQTKSHKSVNIVATVAIFILLAILSISYIYIPRTRTVMFASSTQESLETLNSKTSEVNTALDTLYQSLTASSASEDANLSEIKTDVLSANTSVPTNSFIGNSLLLFENGLRTAEKQGKVKGFSIPESDPNKLIREQRKIAEAVAEKSSSAQTIIDQDIKVLKTPSLSAKTEPLQKEIQVLATKSGEFLSESKKTSGFYIAISDASIEIYNISTTLTNLNDIDNSVVDLSKIRNKFADYDKNMLPNEIEPLNNDVVAIFDLLIGFFKEVSTTNPQNTTALTNSYDNFINKTKSLGTQTYIHELDFWQKNKSLSSYKSLASDFSQAIKQAEELENSNTYFLLPLLGVN